MKMTTFNYFVIRLFCYFVVLSAGCGSNDKEEQYLPPDDKDNYYGNYQPSGKVFIQAIQINDCHDSWGEYYSNCDGIPNPKEAVDVGIVLKNDTTNNLFNVYLKVFTDDIRVAIECQKFDYGEIAASASAGGLPKNYSSDVCYPYGATAMRVRFLEKITWQEEVKFKAKIYASGSDFWEEEFILIFERISADFVFQNYTIVDKGYSPIFGNGNGFADPGEKVGLSIMIKNQGLSGTHNVKAKLSVLEDGGCVSIEKQNLYFADWVSGGNSVSSDYKAGAILERGALLAVAANCQAGTKITFRLEISDYYNNVWQDEFSIYISQEPYR